MNTHRSSNNVIQGHCYVALFRGISYIGENTYIVKIEQNVQD